MAEIAGFLECFREWEDREGPPDDWKVAVLGWLIRLEKYTYDEAILVMHAVPPCWLARIALDGDRTYVVAVTYDAGEHRAVCRDIQFAPHNRD